MINESRDRSRGRDFLYSQTFEKMKPSKAPFAVFIDDQPGNFGKSSPGGLVYKKLILNPLATSAEKQAQLALIQGQIVGFQINEGSKVLFRSNLKQAIESGEDGSRVIKVKVINLAEPNPRENLANGKADKPQRGQSGTSNEAQETEPKTMQSRNAMNQPVEEEQLETVDDSTFVSDEEFEKFVALAFKGPQEGAGAKKDVHDKESGKKAARSTEDSEKPRKSPSAPPTPHLAVTHTAQAVNALLETVTAKAADSKRKFVEKEKEKDKAAAEKEKEIIKRDTERREIKKEGAKEKQKDKVSDKEGVAGVEYNKSIKEGKKPSASEKFKLPGA